MIALAKKRRPPRRARVSESIQVPTFVHGPLGCRDQLGCEICQARAWGENTFEVANDTEGEGAGE
jgi:hypothetical protein